jgi:hypothetical protein
LDTNRKVGLSTGVISARLRWLAVAAALCPAIWGPAGFGLCFLIPGALVQPRAPISGRWLMWIGALFLSLIVVPFGPVGVFERARMLRTDHGIETVAISSLFVASTVLVIWCDLALVMEASRKCNQWVRGSLDWVVWITAGVLNTWCVWVSLSDVRAYRRLGGLRLDLILTAVVSHGTGVEGQHWHAPLPQFGSRGAMKSLIVPALPGPGGYLQSLCKILGAGGPAMQGTALRYS